MPATTRSYHNYEPLAAKPREFRLIHLAGKPPYPRNAWRYVATTIKDIFHYIVEGWFPAWYKTTDVVQCRLEIFDLDNAPQYGALSYTWGDANDTRPVEVDGHVVTVTANLDAALRRLRRLRGCQYLWVDAICIDQSNDVEKSSQVPMMGDIYANAQLVYVWLGEETPETAGALKFIRHSASSIRRDRAGDNEAGITEVSRTLGASTKAIESTMKLLTLPYWQRVWVVQEVSKATVAWIVCGRHAIDFDYLFLAQQMWDRLVQWGLASGRDTAVFQRLAWTTLQTFCWTKLAVSADYRRRWSQGLSRTQLESIEFQVFEYRSIFYLLEQMRHFKTTDPRDRIYALLNLVPPDQRFIKPDYTLTVDQAYKALIVNAVQQSRSLYSVSIGGTGVLHVTPNASLPSWVPRFQGYSDTGRKILPIYRARQGAFKRSEASAASEARCSFSEDFMELTAHGFLCDEILETLPPDLESWKTYTAFYKALQNICNLLRPLEGRYVTGVPMYQALMFALLSDIGQIKAELSDAAHSESMEFFRSRRANDAGGLMLALGMLPLFAMAETVTDSDHEVEEAMKHMAERTDAATSYALCTSYIRSRLAPTEEELEEFYHRAVRGFHGGEPPRAEHVLPPIHRKDDQHWADMLSAFSQMIFVKIHQREFLTTKNGYIGLGREGTLKGDLVCILLGCPVPLIIRPVADGRFVIVGDAHVYGMMEGEVMQKLEDGEFEPRDFTFR